MMRNLLQSSARFRESDSFLYTDYIFFAFIFK